MNLRAAALVTALLLALTTFSAAGQPGGGPGAPAPLVAVGTVGEADDVETKRYTGHIVSSSWVDLVPRVSGELVRLGFKEGDIVEKGQVLYEFDPVRYDAEVKNVEARIAEYQARLNYADLSFKRAAELYSKSAGTKDALDSTESERNAARAALLAAEAQLITTRDDLKNTRIVAPIRGKIGLSNFTEGNYLTPSSGVMATIVQIDPLRVSFSMSNRDFLEMFGTEERLKKFANIRLRLADDSFYPSAGSVEFVDNRVHLSTDTVQIYGRFDNPDNVLVPGSTVTVLLDKLGGGKLPAVTPSAVMHDAESAFVYVVDGDNKVSRRDVVLGSSDTRTQLIKSGLEVGEKIVVDGMHKTLPGGVINPDYKD